MRRVPGGLTAALPRFAIIPRPAPKERLIRARVSETQKAGPLPLWSGYENLVGYPRPARNSSRTALEVSVRPTFGRLLARLVETIRPTTVVEFGTAFGVSGMYWLAALETNGHGRLVTFEPNDAWIDLAVANLSAVGSRFTAVRGTFEDHVAEHIDRGDIDLAFIDAIHTGEFVHAQFHIVKEYAHPGAIVVLDDIGFSADMRRCWEDLAHDQRTRASARVGHGVGMIELA
jgi:predicted O-methyltransferase YrrM